jgi:hypothetical protein
VVEVHKEIHYVPLGECWEQVVLRGSGNNFFGPKVSIIYYSVFCAGRRRR